MALKPESVTTSDSNNVAAYVRYVTLCGFLSEGYPRSALLPLEPVHLLIGGLGALGLINYISLLLLALLPGPSAAAFMPQMTALSNYNFPQSHRAFYNSLVMIGSPVGLMAALVSAGPLYAATGQWSLPLIALGALTLRVSDVDSTRTSCNTAR